MSSTKNMIPETKSLLQSHEKIQQKLSNGLSKLLDGHPFEYTETFDKLQDTVQSLLEASTAKETLDDKRRARKWRGKPQAKLYPFLISFHNLIDSYAGILEIIKGLDPRFGPLASGTLSILLSAAKYKSQYEESIQTGLDRATSQLLRMRRYELQFPNSSIKEYVKKIYDKVMCLAEKACLFYLKSSKWRIWRAISKPLDTSIMEMTGDIDIAVQEVIDEVLILNTEQLTNLTKKSEREDESRFNSLLSQFGIQAADLAASTLMKLCRSLHTEAISKFRRTPHQRRLLERMDLKLLESQSKYCTWKSQINSSLLVLSGRSRFEICQILPEDTKIGFYSLRGYSTIPERHDRQPFKRLLSCIMLQVLCWEDTFTKDYIANVEKTIEEIAQAPDQKTVVRLLVQEIILLLQRWFDKTQSTQVYIIIDRLDRVSDLDIVEVDHALNIISAAGVNVKILIIMESTTWYELEQDCNHEGRLFALKRSEKEISKSKFLRRLNWEQGEIY